MTAPTLPAAPVVVRIRQLGGVRACCGRNEALERAYNRAAAAGRLTVWAADQLAVRVLGEHPLMVWGEDWLTQ